MKWHNAFVFNEKDETFDVYEVYVDETENLRTMSPRLTIYGCDPADAIQGLQLMINDLKEKHVFNSVEEPDQHYNIGD